MRPFSHILFHPEVIRQQADTCVWFLCGIKCLYSHSRLNSNHSCLIQLTVQSQGHTDSSIPHRLPDASPLPSPEDLEASLTVNTHHLLDLTLSSLLSPMKSLARDLISTFLDSCNSLLPPPLDISLSTQPISHNDFVSMCSKSFFHVLRLDSAHHCITQAGRTLPQQMNSHLSVPKVQNMAKFTVARSLVPFSACLSWSVMSPAPKSGAGRRAKCLFKDENEWPIQMAAVKDQLNGTHLKEVLLCHLQRGIEEMQHIARVLDAVLGCLLWSGEPIVPGFAEVFVTAGPIF